MGYSLSITRYDSSRTKDAAAILAATAKRVGAPLKLQDRDWRITPDDHGGLTFSGAHETWKTPEPNLLGRHQHQNIGAALAALNDGRPRGGAYLQADVPEVFDPTGGPPEQWKASYAVISADCTKAAAFLLRLGS
jgi:hypothetical protein